MAQTSGFFNANLMPDGTYDMTYLADEFASYFASFIGNGVYAKQLNELQVVASNPASLTLTVKTGKAWFDGYWYKNDEPFEVQITPSNTPRYDYVSLIFDEANRKIDIQVREGSFVAPSPKPPEHIANELVLAQITVPPSATAITQSYIRDMRTNTVYCGFVSGVVDQINTNDFNTQLQGFIADYIARCNADFLVWQNVIQGLVDQLKDELDQEAETYLLNYCNTLRDTKLDKVPSSAQLPNGFVFQNTGGPTSLIPKDDVYMTGSKIAKAIGASFRMSALQFLSVVSNPIKFASSQIKLTSAANDCFQLSGTGIITFLKNGVYNISGNINFINNDTKLEIFNLFINKSGVNEFAINKRVASSVNEYITIPTFWLTCTAGTTLSLDASVNFESGGSPIGYIQKDNTFLYISRIGDI